MSKENTKSLLAGLSTIVMIWAPVSGPTRSTRSAPSRPCSGRKNAWPTGIQTWTLKRRWHRSAGPRCESIWCGAGGHGPVSLLPDSLANRDKQNAPAKAGAFFLRRPMVIGRGRFPTRPFFATAHIGTKKPPGWPTKR